MFGTSEENLIYLRDRAANTTIELMTMDKIMKNLEILKDKGLGVDINQCLAQVAAWRIMAIEDHQRVASLLIKAKDRGTDLTVS